MIAGFYLQAPKGTSTPNKTTLASGSFSFKCQDLGSRLEFLVD